jgi:hypothetical protein
MPEDRKKITSLLVSVLTRASPETRASLLVRLLKQRLVAGPHILTSPDYKNGVHCVSLLPCIFILPLAIVNFSFLFP